MAVLILDVALGFVLCEEAFEETAVRLLDAPSADSAIVHPFAFVGITILVVVSSSGVSLVVLEHSLEELSVREQDLNLTVSQAVPIESALDDFVGKREEQPVAIWLVVLPFALVDGTCLAELANALAVADSTLIGSLVNISVRVDHLTEAVADAFDNLALINDVFHNFEVFNSLLHHRGESAGQSRSDEVRFAVGRIRQQRVRSFNKLPTESSVLLVLRSFLLLNEGLFAIVVELNQLANFNPAGSLRRAEFSVAVS